MLEILLQTKSRTLAPSELRLSASSLIISNYMAGKLCFSCCLLSSKKSIHKRQLRESNNESSSFLFSCKYIATFLVMVILFETVKQKYGDHK